jgi:phosphoserine phosphatase
MISIAGLGIAFHAKPKVKANAKQSISTSDLTGFSISWDIKILI